MKVGLFFGSFNPIHVGHLIIAQGALNETDLDRVWFVISPQNPLKDKKTLISEYDRLRMVEYAIGENIDLMASNVEFTLPKPSYTIDTLRHLKTVHPEYSFSLIMGEDNIDTLHKWKDYDILLRDYPIYCHPRMGTDNASMRAHYPQVTYFNLSLLDISATRVRQMIQQGKSVRYMVPDQVFEYIQKQGLYVD